MSAGAVELRNTLTSKYGVELPPTAIFDYPTVQALAAFVASKHAVNVAVADSTSEESEEEVEDEEDSSAGVDVNAIMCVLLLYFQGQHPKNLYQSEQC